MRDANGQSLVYVYSRDNEAEALQDKVLTKDKACRIAATEPIPRLKRFRVSIAENKMRAFFRRFFMHYGIYRRYPLGWFPALRNAWRAAQP